MTLSLALILRAVLILMVLIVPDTMLYAGSLATPTYVEGEVLVSFKSTYSAVQFSATQPGVAAMRYVGAGVHSIELQPDETVDEMVQQLQANPLVEFAQPNYIKHLQTNDPHYSSQWGLKNSGQTAGQAGADINVETAWGVTLGDPAVIVAVLDTGVSGGDKSPHPDLKNQLWHNPGETGTDVNGKDKATNGIDDDNNGCVDDIIGCDFSVSSGNQIVTSGDPIDTDGHGTSVAGVIGAEADNGIGISGVSPGVKLMIVKAFDGTTSTTRNVVAALDYALAMGARVINASYGFKDPSSINSGFDGAEYRAIRTASQQGVMFVAAAGNGDQNNIGYSNDGPAPYYPSSYDLRNIIAVAATDDRDALAGFSNYGSTSVDLAAPGKGIYTTLKDGGYGWVDGTSAAVPFVTGTLALMLSVEGDHTVEGLRSRLLTGVDPIQELQGLLASGGRLDAAGALNASPTIPLMSSGGGAGSSLLLLLIINFISLTLTSSRAK